VGLHIVVAEYTERAIVADTATTRTAVDAGGRVVRLWVRLQEWPRA